MKHETLPSDVARKTQAVGIVLRFVPLLEGGGHASDRLGQRQIDVFACLKPPLAAMRADSAERPNAVIVVQGAGERLFDQRRRIAALQGGATKYERAAERNGLGRPLRRAQGEPVQFLDLDGGCRPKSSER